MPELKLLFLQMMVILVTARVLASASRLVGQPAVVGEMVADSLRESRDSCAPTVDLDAGPHILNSQLVAIKPVHDDAVRKLQAAICGRPLPLRTDDPQTSAPALPLLRTDRSTPDTPKNWTAA
jgi:hypothetical protein